MGLLSDLLFVDAANAASPQSRSTLLQGGNLNPSLNLKRKSKSKASPQIEDRSTVRAGTGTAAGTIYLNLECGHELVGRLIFFNP